MAPSLVDLPAPTAPDAKKVPVAKSSGYKEAFSSNRTTYNAESELKGTATQPPASFPNYLPTWSDKIYPPLEPFEHTEHGKNADPSYPNLLHGEAKLEDVTGTLGAEVWNVQLSQLDDKGKDELAHLVATKGVVAFRNQDFASRPIEEVVNMGSYFGRHHIHPTSGAPDGFPEIHLVHRGADDKAAQNFFEDRINSTAWHSDITYEQQPPGTTFLWVLDNPKAGGDTLFSNQVEAYKRLSPEFQKRLHGLKALHSASEQANSSSARGGIVRREPVSNVHPVVRTHPITGEKALFVNPQFTKKIVGYKTEESEYLLKFLFDHMSHGYDFQARMRWLPGTVVVWDNRVCTHTAILDWQNGQRRHIARITPQAERPYETPFEG